MAGKKKITIKSKQQKKKRWYNIVASPEFKSVSIGETPALAPENLEGRKFKVNMMTLTRDMKKQSFVITFKVKEVKGNDAITEFMQYEMSGVHVKRVVKKGKDKVDDSFVVKTKDDVNVRVKPLLITRNKVQHSVKTTLRAETKVFIEKVAKEKDFFQFASSVLGTELQKTMKGTLKKVYPLSFVEIRVFKRL
jgi:ribosomal protein S3AE